jgi:hypothetical protein
MPMKRFTIPLLVMLGLLALAPLAAASDKSLENALKPYKTKLTTDVAYLAAFKAPSKSKAGGVLKKLSKIEGDLNGAKNAANGQQASTSGGTQGRSEVLSGVGDLLAGAGDAKSSASAAKAGKSGKAKSDAKQALKEINKAIPVLEAGGMKLKLF